MIIRIDDGYKMGTSQRREWAWRMSLGYTYYPTNPSKQLADAQFKIAGRANTQILTEKSNNTE
jgi:hypothetical protein